MEIPPTLQVPPLPPPRVAGFEWRHCLQVLLSTTTDSVREMAARLVNVLATDPIGRGYLVSGPEVVDWLVAVVTRERRDTVTRMNALGALQKLSIRRAAANAAMRRGVIEWLLKLLQSHVRGARACACLRARTCAYVRIVMFLCPSTPMYDRGHRSRCSNWVADVRLHDGVRDGTAAEPRADAGGPAAGGRGRDGRARCAR